MAISEKNILSFTNQDYNSIMEEIKLTKKTLMPEYTDTSDTDFGNLILTYVAMLSDVLSWKIDYSTNEAIPALCETIKAMYTHCKFIGYKPKSNQSAKAEFVIKIANNGEQQNLEKGFKVTMEYQVNGDYVVYELDSDVDCTAPVGTAIDAIYEISATGTQGETVSETIGYSDGKIDQDFYITYSPYIEGSLEVEAYNSSTETSEFYKINENNSFIGTTSTDTVIVLEQVDSDLIKVKFGDGYNGKVPLVDTQLIAHYRIGGGTIGNRPANSINIPISEMPENFISITNSTEAIGGVNALNVNEIKALIEKGGHKTIHSLMIKRDYDNYLSHRSDMIEKFKVCHDTLDAIRLFNPIAIYLKPYNSLAFDSTYKTSLLADINKLKLIDDTVNIYDTVPIFMTVEVKIKSDGLVIESQLLYSIKSALKSLINGIEIGDGEEIIGLYSDDVQSVIKNVSGVSRFISLDKLWTKYTVDVSGEVLVANSVIEVVLKRGQMFWIEDIENDIKITFV